MVVGFGQSDVQRQITADRDNQDNAADVSLAQQMFDPNKVAIDSQVSALLLEMKSRFLEYDIDYKRKTMICIERYPYLEPWGEEPKSFLEGQKPQIISEIDMLLSEIYNYSKKYDEDMSGIFNEVVRVRQSLLGISRATGKAAKVSKSQYVESNAFVRRDMQNKPQSKGLLGIGIMGL